MAEAISIIQTIKWGSDTLWEFVKLVERYRVLPERVADLEENLHACEVTLRRWKSRWGVESRQPNVYYEILWSKRGWRAIRLCLGAIDEIATLLKIKINDMLGSAFKYQGRSRNQAYDGRFDKAMMRSALRRIDQSMSRRRRFVWAVLIKADDLDGQIARFNTKLTNLERFAESYLFETHPTLFGKDGRKLQKAKQSLIEDRLRDKRRVITAAAREDAMALHSAFIMSSEGLTAHIALARSQGGDIRLQKDFFFLISNGDQAKEVKVHPVQFDAADDIKRLPSSISKAFDKLTRSSHNRRVDLLPANAVDGFGFELHPTPSTHLTSLATQDPLSTVLTSPRTSGISTKDKLSISAALVEESHRLLGTPWLNYLCTTNIRGSRGTDAPADWTAMLQAQPGSRTITRAFASFASQPSNRSRSSSLLYHQHIFRLGIVLAELALGTTVSYAEASEDILVPGINIVIPEVAEDERLDADEIAAEVEGRSGSVVLGDLVRWCLSVLMIRGKIKMSDQEVGQDFEAGVVERAREMAAVASSSR